MSEGFSRKQAATFSQPGTGGHGRDFRRGELMQRNAALNDYIERRGLRTPLETENRERIQRANAARTAAWRAKQ